MDCRGKCFSITDWKNSTKHNTCNSFFSRDQRFYLFSKNPRVEKRKKKAEKKKQVHSTREYHPFFRLLRSSSPKCTKQSRCFILLIIPHSCGAAGKVLGEEGNASLLRSPKSFGIGSPLTLL